jgi:hypothetical protein
MDQESRNDAARRLCSRRGSLTPARLAVLGLVLFMPSQLASCGDCAGVGAPSVRVTVLDFDTNASIAPGATLSLFPSNASTPIAVVTGALDAQSLTAGDSAGRFDVLVEKPGYFPSTISNVEVKGACTTETVELTIHLRHLPPP